MTAGRAGVPSTVGGLGAGLGSGFASNLSSFTEYLRLHAPEMLPGNRIDMNGNGPDGDVAPHGTTIVALTFAGGVVIAGDRRATMGNLIASRDVEKVFVTDDYSAAGIAGTAGGGDRAGPVVRRRTRALREDRGRPVDVRRQSQPVVVDGARQPRCRDAGPRGGAAARRFRPGRARPRTGRPDRVVRRRGWTVRGAGRLPRRRIRIAVREVIAQEAVPRRRRRGLGPADGDRGALRRRRRRFRHRWTRPGALDLSDGGVHHLGRRGERARRADRRTGAHSSRGRTEEGRTPR